MKCKFFKKSLIAGVLAACTALSSVSVTALAAGINYIDKINVTYEHINYKAGEAPRATAAVTQGNCTVAYEYWREIEQKEAGSVWTGTGCYWYSDADKMAALSEEKRITRFEAGKHYSYNIVLVTDRGYFINDEETVVSVGNYEWGTPGKHINLEIKEMSTKLYIYSPYSIDIPDDKTDKVIKSVSIIGVNKNLDSSQPITFNAHSDAWCAGQYDVIEEAWEAGGSVDDVIKSTDSAPRAPIAGVEYWYSIVLKTKDGYVFSKDFSDSRHQIKEGSDVNFMVGGVMYDGRFAVSDDGKTLTAWEFMDPITAKAPTQDIKQNTPTNGTAVINGKTVLYKDNKAVQGTKIIVVAGKTYVVVNGYVATGSGYRLVKIGKKTYAVDKFGIVATSKGNKIIKIGKKSYAINKKGELLKGKKYRLVKVKKRLYIANKSGVVLKNKKSVKIGKKVYKINQKGIATKKK